MKYLLFLAFAVSFAGADCGTPSGLTRTCSGSQPQNLYFKVTGSCGDQGTMEVTVANAGDCSIAVIEPTGVGLPPSGSFNDLAGGSGYDLSKGNWNLDDLAMGDMSVGTFLDCTGGAANAAGEFDESCEERVCTPGEDEVTCATGNTCTAHLSPTSAPASSGDAGK